MSNPTLQRHTVSDAVALLQSELNKVGAMLSVDSDFGPGTERGVRYAQALAGLPVTGIADEQLWIWLASRPAPFPRLHTDGVAFIAREETGGLAYYEQVTRWPHYPGGDSGITIGAGFDLRFNTKSDFLASWGGVLSPEIVDTLLSDIGRQGTRERAEELRDAGVTVPFGSAWMVFIGTTLPNFYQITESIYPSLSRLPDFCRSVLVSLVFNRGPRLTGDSRREMTEIRDILLLADDDALDKEQKKAKLDGIEDALLAMKRLWDPRSGLISRRQNEANLWRRGLALW